MFDQFITKIKNKEPFSFIRIGDGEAHAMFDDEPEGKTNTDGHLYYKDMGEALRNVILSKPKYFLGMQRFAREETHPQQIEAFIKNNHLEDIEWVNADVWHHASIKGYFEDLFEVLKDREVIFVAPEYLRVVKQFNWNHFVSVPDRNCWLEKDRIVQEVSELLKNENIAWTNVVVLVCASMPAKIIINELYQDFGERHTLLDIGSVLDPYVKKASRSYHKKIIQRLLEDQKGIERI